MMTLDMWRQIRQKEYCEKLKQEQVGNIIVVGISYSTAEKAHQCVIEEI